MPPANIVSMPDYPNVLYGTFSLLCETDYGTYCKVYLLAAFKSTEIGGTFSFYINFYVVVDAVLLAFILSIIS
jgi:hypothetical protein